MLVTKLCMLIAIKLAKYGQGIRLLYLNSKARCTDHVQSENIDLEWPSYIFDVEICKQRVFSLAKCGQCARSLLIWRIKSLRAIERQGAEVTIPFCPLQCNTY
jgi:hypothetical protein